MTTDQFFMAMAEMDYMEPPDTPSYCPECDEITGGGLCQYCSGMVDLMIDEILEG